MEEDIISEIAAAEAKGAQKKADAAQRAAALLSEAEKDAAERGRLSELDCAMLRAEKTKEAEGKAEREYSDAIASCRASSKKYADDCVAHADVYVAEIVGRLVK